MGNASGKSLPQTFLSSKNFVMETLPAPADGVQLAHRASEGPDLDAILDYFHAGTPNGFVSFYRKPAGRKDAFLDVGAVDVRTLRKWRDDDGEAPMLPGLIEQLIADAYFTLNAMVRAGIRVREREKWVSEPVEVQYPGRPAEIQYATVPKLTREIQRKKPGTHGLLYAHRAERDAKWLPQCWVDVDGHNATPATDGPGTVANILRAHRRGLIPTPSFIVASGQGAWALWQIVDERNPAEGRVKLGTEWHERNTPCRGSRYAIQLQHAINAALAERLAGIGADAQACDGARCCRVPGSINTKAHAVVEILPVLINGAMRVYTLSDLEAELGLRRKVRGRPPKDVGPAQLSPAQRTQRQNAIRARHRRVYDAILKLSELRGGLDEGYRNYGLFYLTLHGTLAGLPASEVEATVRATARACQRDGGGLEISGGQVRGILRSGAKKARQTRTGASYATIAAHLGMTGAERIATGLVKRERTVGRRTLAEREAAILATLERLGLTETTAPSTRQMQDLLAGVGITASHNAVAEDYRRLGITSERRGGRRKPEDLFSDAAAIA